MQFMCFYTSKPVAAMYPITEDDFPQSRADIQSFWEKLDQVVFEKQSANFILQVCRDGLIKIHAPNIEVVHPIDSEQVFVMSVNWQKKWGKYLNFLNAFYVILYSSTLHFKWGGDKSVDMLDFCEITRNDAFQMNDRESNPGLSSVYHAGVSRREIYRSPSASSHPLLISNSFLHEDILACAAEQFEQVSGNEELIRLLSELAKSLSEFKQFNNTSSLIMAWFGIEKIINRMWGSLKGSPLFEEREIDILNSNKNKKGEIMDLDRYTVFNKINGLHVVGLLENYDFDCLGKCRKERNDIAHNDKRIIDDDIAIMVNQLLIKLINMNFDLNIRASFNISTVAI